MESPKDSHWKTRKIILRNIVCTVQHGIFHKVSKDNSLLRYINSDFANHKNTSSYAFQIGTNLISWTSKKQPIITISSIEAKYVATTSSTYHVVYSRILLGDLEHEDVGDNASINVTRFGLGIC